MANEEVKHILTSDNFKKALVAAHQSRGYCLYLGVLSNRKDANGNYIIDHMTETKSFPRNDLGQCVDYFSAVVGKEKHFGEHIL